MTTKAAENVSAYGDISNAPGRRQQARTIETIEGQSLVLGSNPTVKAAHEAIAAAAIADRAAGKRSIGRARSVPAGFIFGAILSYNTLVGGSGYKTGSYTDVPLTGGNGSDAEATIVVDNSGPIDTLTGLVGGSGYDDGTYLAVPLTGGSGSGALADITVAGGEVTGVTIADGGTGYVTGEVLSADDADLGGLGGSGFGIAVGDTKGSVVGVTITDAGSGYESGDTLSAVDANIGGLGGSGFSITVVLVTD
jgi:hypothetical protein